MHLTRGPKDQGYEATIKSVEQSLAALQTSYIDLYLIHWPGKQGLSPSDPLNAERRKESWKALESLVQLGKLRCIGVSNYLVPHLNELLSFASIVPAVNQFELHPCLFDKDLVRFCESHGIVVQSYSSLGQGHLLTDEYAKKYPIFAKLRSNYSRPFSQVLLRWVVQHGWIAIPKSCQEERIKENAGIFDFELTEEEMKQLDEIGMAHRFCWDPHSVL